MAERVLRGQGRIAPVVDPPEVNTVDIAAGDDSKVEHQVREASSRLGVALNYMLEAFDDGGTAELDVPLDDSVA